MSKQLANQCGPDDRLRTIIGDVERDCAAFMAPVRERILRRVIAAYWLGAGDGLDVAPEIAERRRKPRD